MAIENQSTKLLEKGGNLGITWPQIFKFIRRGIIFKRIKFVVNIFKTKCDEEIFKFKKISNFKSLNTFKKFKIFIKRINLLSNSWKIQTLESIFRIIPPILTISRESLIDIELTRIHLIMSKLLFMEIESKYIVNFEDNFDKLNINHDHPARLDHGFFKINENKLLRSHVTSFHHSENLSNYPLGQYYSLGRVFRDDQDSTHLNAFYQLDWLIKKDTNLNNFKNLIERFLKLFFEDENIELFLRPSFFPFTFSSFEIDMKIENQIYEIAGAGFMHPKAIKFNKKINLWPALGFGIERLIMIKYKLQNIKDCYSHKRC